MFAVMVRCTFITFRQSLSMLDVHINFFCDFFLEALFRILILGDFYWIRFIFIESCAALLNLCILIEFYASSLNLMHFYWISCIFIESYASLSNSFYFNWIFFVFIYFLLKSILLLTGNFNFCFYIDNLGRQPPSVNFGSFFVLTINVVFVKQMLKQIQCFF